MDEEGLETLPSSIIDARKEEVESSMYPLDPPARARAERLKREERAKADFEFLGGDYDRPSPPESLADTGTDMALQETLRKRADRMGMEREADKYVSGLERKGRLEKDRKEKLDRRVMRTEADAYVAGLESKAKKVKEEQKKKKKEEPKPAPTPTQIPAHSPNSRENQVRQDVFMQTGDAFAADRAYHQAFTGFDSAGNYTPFYVGGVPTKPMKPQRLKKGGLASRKKK